MPRVYRICKQRYPVFDAAGSLRAGGRWTSPGFSILYAAEHFATAILEQLVHAGRLVLPGAHHAAALLIPDGLPAERFEAASNRGWADEGSQTARDYGDAWARASATSVLWVPSVPGRPEEWNVLVNLAHSDAKHVHVGPTFDVNRDSRLMHV